MTDFSFAKLSDWAKQVEARMDAIVQTSIERLLEDAQLSVAKGGNMPVKSGTLRGSLRSSLNGGTVINGETSFVVVAENMRAGDVAEFSWKASYARRVNYGFVGVDKLGRTYNQGGRLFVEKALAKWPRIVSEECENAERAVKGGA